MCVIERIESVFVSVIERDKVCVCVCVCDSECVCVCDREG